MKPLKNHGLYTLSNTLFTIYLFLIYPFCVIRFPYTTNLAIYGWYFDNDTHIDYYLGARSVSLLAAALFAIIMLIVSSLRSHKLPRLLCNKKIAIAMVAYIICVTFSTIFSINRYTSMHGGLDQFESCFVLISYLAIFLYAHENCLLDYVLHSGTCNFCLYVSTILLIILGLIQGSEVYLTFYNPDYCSVYLFILIALFVYKILRIINRSHAESSKTNPSKYSIAMNMLTILCLLYLQVRTGCVCNISLTFALIITVVLYSLSSSGLFQQKSNFHKLFCILAASVIVVAFLFTCYKYTSDLEKPTLITKEREQIISISTTDKNVTIVTDRDTYYLTSDMENGPLDYQKGAIFTIFNGYETMSFTNETSDGNYMFILPNGQLVSLRPAKCVFFENYPSFLSGRGYIWARTLPLLADTLFIGTGPDTFLIIFPHNDYVESLVNGYLYQLVNKPHSVYLQIAVQTGVVSLICILCIVLSQIVTCAKGMKNEIGLRNKKAFKLIILICSIGLCLSGLLNDSNLSVMPYVILIISAL